MDAALDGGADYVGLVFYPRSPRHVSLGLASELANRARGRSQIVALLVDPRDEAIDAVMDAVRPDLIQLHGTEDVERVAQIHTRTSTPIIKALRVADAANVQAAFRYEDLASIILFDAAPRSAGALPGGNGEAFDWSVLAPARGKLRFMLSGGLRPETVAAAIQATGASAVDVSSGVEIAPGEKDPDLIRCFLRNAKAAKQP